MYRETHIVRTDKFGLYNLQIGGGTAVSGTFKDIPWSSGQIYFVELDPGRYKFCINGDYTTIVSTLCNVCCKYNISGAVILKKLTNVDDSAGYE